MKIKNNFTVEIKRDGGYLRGFVIIDGVRQLVDIIPREIESCILLDFLNLHVMPSLEMGRQGRTPYKKGRALN